MANSKIDSQLERMKYLMEFKNPQKTDTKGGIEYHINSSNGKTYGIIRENNMYYIKTTTPDKAMVKESYEYLGGFNYRNEHGYKSFNEATKHLELELMAINESCGKHEDVSITFDPNKGKKDMQTLSEAARVELNRMHQILENSQKIGQYNTGDPESKGKATAENTTKNNAPFEEKTEASLDKDPKFNGTVKGATPDNKDVKVTDTELGSDKMKTANSGSEKDYKDAHDDLDGESIADKKPKGGKVVKVNEGFDQDVDIEMGMFDDNDDNLAGFDGGEDEVEDIVMDEPEMGMEDGMVDEPDMVPGEEGDLSDADFAGDDVLTGEDDYDLDSLLEEFMSGESEVNAEPELNEEEGKEAILKGEPSTLAGDAGKGDNSVKGEETMDKMVNEDADNHKPEGAGEKESKIVGPDAVMDSEEGAGNLPVQTWDKMDKKLQESIDKITDAVCDRLRNKKIKKDREELKSRETPEEYLQEAIDRMVKEEVTKLNAWGKHPRYQKPAFKTPDNHEVAPNGSKDWNDDSVKGSETYGKKIGSSAPFDKQVDMLTDAVVNMIKENFLKKK